MLRLELESSSLGGEMNMNNQPLYQTHNNPYIVMEVSFLGWRSLSGFLPGELGIIAAMSGGERGLVASPRYILDYSVNS